MDVCVRGKGKWFQLVISKALKSSFPWVLSLELLYYCPSIREYILTEWFRSGEISSAATVLCCFPLLGILDPFAGWCYRGHLVKNDYNHFFVGCLFGGIGWWILNSEGGKVWSETRLEWWKWLFGAWSEGDGFDQGILQTWLFSDWPISSNIARVCSLSG